MIVTGIGSRKIDANQYAMIVSLARFLRKRGYHLRSGGAIGSDSAFEEGWVGSDQKTIYLPEPGFNRRPVNDACYPTPTCDHIWFEAEDTARKIHPNFDALDEFSRNAHTRNIYQVLGDDLRSPSDLVIACALPKGKSVNGGTATAFNLAKAKGIPTFNIWLLDQRKQLLQHLQGCMGNVSFNLSAHTGHDLFEACCDTH